MRIFYTSFLFLSIQAFGADYSELSDLKKIEDLLHSIDELEPTNLWQAVSPNEILTSSLEDREPRYLALIHKAYGMRLRDFVGRLSIEDSREARIRHGINLIYLMSTVNSAAHSAAWGSANSAAGYSADNRTWVAALKAVGYGAAKYAPGSGAMCIKMPATWYTAMAAARHTSDYSSWHKATFFAREASANNRNASEKISLSDAWHAAHRAAGNPGWDDAWDAARFVANEIISITENLSTQAIGRLTYRVAEVTVLLYCLKFALDDPAKEFKGIFSKTYQASDEVLKRDGLPEDLSIWESQEGWDAFYAEHFSDLSQNTLAFLTPYLEEINKTRLAILNHQS